MKYGMICLAFAVLTAMISCGRSDSNKELESSDPQEKLEAPTAPKGVECTVEFKDGPPPYKVGQAHRVKLTTTIVDPADVVLASTNGCTTNYQKEVDGYDYILTASRPGVVRLLVYHKTEVGDSPLCTFDYEFR